VASFVAHARWTAEELHRVAYTIRGALHEELARLPSGDARWRRAAALLPGSIGGDAPGLLSALLERERERDLVKAFLRAAAGTPRDGRLEAPILRWLSAHPEEALAALEVHGGEEAEAALVAALSSPLAFGSARGRAMNTLWRIARDRVALVAGIDPRDAPRTALLAASVDDGRVRALDARLGVASAEARFAAVSALAGYEQRDLMSARFRAAYLAAWRGRRSDPEAPWRVEARALAYGARLQAEERRADPLDARDDAAWLRDEALRWLREDGAPRVALLTLLRRHPLDAVHVARLQELWRDRDHDVRRAAMELLVDAGAEGLALSFGSLATSEDLRARRQGLRAIARFEARWAEPFAREALQSPNMNLKKAAVDALAVVGSAETVPALLAVLGRWDNPGLRAGVLRALDRIAGAAATPLLVDAHASSTGDARAMLLRALEGRLTVAQLQTLCAHRPDVGGPLRAAHRGGLRLADGSLEADGGSRPGDEPAAIADLRREGFSAERAAAALEVGVPGELISARLPEWVAFLRGLRERGELERREKRRAKRATGREREADSLPEETRSELPRETAREASLRKPRHALGGPPADSLRQGGGWNNPQETSFELQRETASAASIRKARNASGETAVRIHFGKVGVRDGPLADSFDAHAFAAATVALSELASRPEATSILELARWMGDRDAPVEGRDAARRALAALAEHDARVRRDALEVLRTLRPVSPREWWASLRSLGGGRSAADLTLCLEGARGAEAKALLRELAPEGDEVFGSPSTRAERIAELLDARPPGASRPPRMRIERRETGRAWPGDDVPRRQREDAGRRLLEGGNEEDVRLVLERFLDGVIDAVRPERLAPALREWPDDPSRAERALVLLPRVPDARRRPWIAGWLRGWRAGDEVAQKALDRCDPVDVAEILAREGALLDGASARWIERLPRALRLRLGEAHAELAPPPAPEPEPEVEDLDEAGLREAARGRGDAAARALGLLGAAGDAEALRAAARHRDGRARTVALRWLRRLLPPAEHLAIALEMLRAEKQKDLRRQLVRVLAHGRHAPAYPFLVGLLFDRDRALARHTEEALLRIAPEVRGAVVDELRRVRPDRRARLAAFLAALEERIAWA